jgi:hypothetical protein
VSASHLWLSQDLPWQDNPLSANHRAGFSARFRSFAADDRYLTLVRPADIYR